MATFKFGRAIDLHWNGYDIQGPAETVFSIPDQLYEEFDGDIAPVEPTLVWIDTNEFQTLQDSVVTSTIVGSAFITTASLTSGTQISIVSGSATSGYVLTANGTGGVSFAAAPGGAGALSAVIGTSPMSVLTSSGTATVSIDQTALSVSNADTATTLRTYVKNSSGSTITKGQVVYITGADGTNALIGLASASSDPTSSKTLGIAANTMTNNAFGYVIENGQLSNIDTSAATAGSSVWLSATPGAYVFNSPPAEPDHAVYLGVVTKANVSTGEILVKVQNGYELDELHDVFVGGVSTALPLVYSSTSSGWVAQALSSVGIADNAIVESKINAGAVTSAKIGAAAINSTHIGANAVVAGDIAANAVTSGNIAAGAVGSAALADNAVVAAKINAAAVGTAKIDSTGGSSGWVLTADGSGAATFAVLGSSTDTTKISLSTITAKGDIIAGSAASTAVAVSIGASGKILASGGTSTSGLTWANSSLDGKNKIMNSDFSITQRGTGSITINSDVREMTRFDRWAYLLGSYTSAGPSITVQNVIGTDLESFAPTQHSRFLRWSNSASTSSWNEGRISQRIAGVRNLSGKKATLSMWINSSNQTSIKRIDLVQNFGTGGSPSSSVTTTVNSSQTITSTWVRYAWTFTVPSTSAATLGTNANDYLDLQIFLSTGTSNATQPTSGQWNIFGVQLEEGEIATDLSLSNGTFDSEFLSCQRYYCAVEVSDSSTSLGVGMAVTSTSGRAHVSYPTKMIKKPTLIDTNGSFDLWDGTNSISFTPALSRVGLTSTILTSTIASGVVNRPYIFRGTTTGAAIFFEAEV